jgi:hypothetical protein
MQCARLEQLTGVGNRRPQLFDEEAVKLLRTTIIFEVRRRLTGSLRKARSRRRWRQIAVSQAKELHGFLRGVAYTNHECGLSSE